jgi:PAS domain S-box-containing protein
MVASILYNDIAFQKKLLDTISANIFSFIAVINKSDRKIVFVNRVGATIFEYKSPNEMLGMFAPSLWKEIPGEDQLRAIDEEIDSKGYFSGEIEYKTKNGTFFWGLMQRNPFSVKGMDFQLIQIEKIDRAKAAEENLLKEKQRFGALMNYASIGVVIVDEDQQIILGNSFAGKLFGYSTEELKGKKLEMLIPSRFREKHRSHQQSFYANPISRPMGLGMDLFAVRKDGSEFPVEVSLGTYKTENQTFAIAFVSDITIRKKAEQEITQLNAGLEKKVMERTNDLAITISKLEHQIVETKKAQDELLTVMTFQKAVLNFSGAMVIATNPEGIITLFNPAAEKLLGYKAREVIGKYDPSLFHVSREVKERTDIFSKELKINISPGFETLVIKSKQGLPNKEEWIYVKKNGKQFPVSLTITALQNKRNEITGFLGVAVDISETKKKEEELKKALEVEKELNILKSRFVSIASHEFRTPLSAILSSLYLLEKYTGAEDHLKREKHIGRIVSSVNILTDILNDFLSVGKIEEGKITLTPIEIDVTSHINNCIDELKEIRKKGQQIIYEHSGEHIVSLDTTLLRHIVINLLSNAVKFSPEDSEISIKTKVSAQTIELTVTDHGIGIPQEDQQHMFERFFRGSNATGIQGTGLGLHIIQKYAEMMNGKVNCVSEQGKKTDFIVELRRNDFI